jgi:hypothetical protein
MSANGVAHEGGAFETIERKNTDIFLSQPMNFREDSDWEAPADEN